MAKALLLTLHMDTDLKEKQGLQPLLTIVKDTYDYMGAEGTEINEIMDIIPYCKVSKMYDSAHKKLTFAMPMSIVVGEKRSTLASAVSRLLTSYGTTRKTGSAPAGFLERQLSTVLGNSKHAK